MIDSPVLRGVSTALGWITPGGLAVSTHATLRVGPPIGLDPEAYRFPVGRSDAAI